MQNEPDEDNTPDFAGVEFNFAMEYLARMFKDLKSGGLTTHEAAAIVAAIITAGAPNG